MIPERVINEQDVAREEKANCGEEQKKRKPECLRRAEGGSPFNSMRWQEMKDVEYWAEEEGALQWEKGDEVESVCETG